MKAITAILFLGLALATPLEADTTVTINHNHLRGEAVFAQWDITEGDIVTLVSVIVSEDQVQERTNGQPDRFKASVGTVTIFRTDLSNFHVLIEGVMDVEDFEFDVSPTLGTGFFRADGIFQDFSSFTFFDMSVDLSFEAIGERAVHNDRHVINEPGFHLTARFNGVHRPAVGMGSIVGRGEEFTPVPSNSAEMQRNRFGDLTIEMTRPAKE